MNLKASLLELTEPENRKIIEYGVSTGYAVTIVMVVLGLMFQHIGLLPNAMEMVVMLAPLKLLTNTAMWLALRLNKHVLLTATINQFADSILLTGVVYYTGGPASPITSVYFIVLAITATLSNMAATVLTGVTMLLSYFMMMTLIASGVLHLQQPFLAIAYQSGRVSTDFVIVDTMRVMFMLGILVAAMVSGMRMLQSQKEALKAKNAELQEASRLKSEFLANVTHELRTPIHGVLGMTEMLEEGIYGPVNDKQTDALGRIRSSAEGLLHMIDDLLSFERINTARLSVRLSQVELRQVLMEVKEVCDRMRGKKQLDIHVLGEPLTLIAGDRVVIGHILTNLASNAVKFTPEGGRIELSVARDGVYAVIEVRDTGVGIQREELQKIWEPFRQVDGSLARQFGGVGLGLAVVAQLANSIEAEVSATSEPGNTVFTLRLKGALPD